VLRFAGNVVTKLTVALACPPPKLCPGVLVLVMRTVVVPVVRALGVMVVVSLVMGMESLTVEGSDVDVERGRIEMGLLGRMAWVWVWGSVCPQFCDSYSLHEFSAAESLGLVAMQFW
jgi:hypothetical protein